MFACEKFRSYIVDSKVTIHTDHAAIKYLIRLKRIYNFLWFHAVILSTLDVLFTFFIFLGLTY